MGACDDFRGRLQYGGGGGGGTGGSFGMKMKLKMASSTPAMRHCTSLAALVDTADRHC
jgi:hypothetical protein